MKKFSFLSHPGSDGHAAQRTGVAGPFPGRGGDEEVVAAAAREAHREPGKEEGSRSKVS